MSDSVTLTPREIVSALDQNIIGQRDAKEQVAIALRFRCLRQSVKDEELRREITPKNILMIGPTGVGKTEIARRLASIAKAPFVKVEATKFTEVGYVGREVESMVKDLVDASVKITREQEKEKVRVRTEEGVDDLLLEVLLPNGRDAKGQLTDSADATRQLLRQKLQEGGLDEQEVELEMPVTMGVDIMGPPGMEEMTNQLQGLFQRFGSDKRKVRKMKVKEARKQLFELEASKYLNEDDIRSKALENAEQNGIIFIDEFDKIVQGTGDRVVSGGVSREGVQRDLLPLVEGCSVTTKYGVIKTDHILFIASGAFQLAKPSDLVPELQGRFPIRVELSPLTANDFVRILTEPKSSLIKQYVALMGVEGLKLNFTDDGIEEIAEAAFNINDSDENIGARRLHTVMEYLLRPISFEASDKSGEKRTIDAKYVKERLKAIMSDGQADLSRYIL